MATNFPTNIDTFTDQTSSDLITSAKWNNLQDSIEALEVKVGADESGVETSFDYRIDSLEKTTDSLSSTTNSLSSTADSLLNAVPPVGSILSYVPGHFTNGSNGGFTTGLSANTVDAANAELNPKGWYVCNGAALNLEASPIFNGAGRYLPNLTDSRFIMGATAAGGAGGSAAHTHTMAHTHTIAHTHTTGNLTLTVSQIPKHRHKVSNDAAGGTGNTEGMVVANAGLHGNTSYWNYTHSGNSSEVGGGAAHNHGSTGNPSNANSGASSAGSTGSSSLLPTYLSCLYIMRVR